MCHSLPLPFKKKTLAAAAVTQNRGKRRTVRAVAFWVGKREKEKNPFFLPLLICDQWQVSSPPRRPPTLPLLWRRLAAAETMQKAPQFLSAANSKGGGDERVEQ